MIRFSAIFLTLAFTVLYGFGHEAVKIQTIKIGQQYQFSFNIEKGFGVQRDGEHKLDIYRLKPGHEKASNLREKVQKYGEKVASLPKLSGTIARADKEYFSTLKSVSVPLPSSKTGTYVLHGRILYCSFADKFCSAQSVGKILP